MGALPGYSDRVQKVVCVGSERVNFHSESEKIELNLLSDYVAKLSS